MANEKDNGNALSVLVILADGDVITTIHRTFEGCIAAAKKDFEESCPESGYETGWDEVERSLREDRHCHCYCYDHVESNTTYIIAENCPICD